MADFTIGVEEEFLIVHGHTGALCPCGPELVPVAQNLVSDVAFELHRSQVETATPVCSTLDEVRAELLHRRRALTAAAARRDCQIAATATHPSSSWLEDPGVLPKYAQLEDDYGQLAREQIICGCHVHVGVSDDEAVIHVMNRVRPWLSPLVALAANSPFWQGRDTGYASYRTEVWRRWPMAGTPEPFASREEYERLVALLLSTGSIDDRARIYWDIRPSAKFPTVEFRVSDVCLTVREAVMVAGLTRAVARTAYLQGEGGEPVPAIRPELIKAATWRAARHGVDGKLVDLLAGEAVAAAVLIERFLTMLRPALEEFGDWDEVSESVERVLAEGNGARRQRAALARSGEYEDVVAFVVEETVAG